MFVECLEQIIFDAVALYFAEGHDTDTVAAQLWVGEAPDDFVDDDFRFFRVAAGVPLVIDTVHLYQSYLGHMVVDGGEGEQVVAVILRIAEGN